MAESNTCELPPTIVTGSEIFNRDQLLSRQPVSDDEASEFDHDRAGRRMLQVLVVDDDQDTADGLVWLVRRWGHAVRIAYDGGIALQVAADQCPDVVLLDLEMPLMDGCQVATQLRLDLPKTECFIIVVTGDTDERGRRECLEAGIDLVLIKPVNSSIVETLLRQVHRRLDRAPTGDAIPSGRKRLVPIHA
jgi:CheY-like chemotaxis protein